MAEIRAFKNPAYHDALDLLSEAHTYVSYRQALDESKMTPRQRMLISYETMRLTARLTQIMAWLIMQRAVQNGEGDKDELDFDRADLVSANILNLDDHDTDEATMPAGLRNLLDRSQNLYVRIQRLEHQPTQQEH